MPENQNNDFLPLQVLLFPVRAKALSENQNALAERLVIKYSYLPDSLTRNKQIMTLLCWDNHPHLAGGHHPGNLSPSTHIHKSIHTALRAHLNAHQGTHLRYNSAPCFFLENTSVKILEKAMASHSRTLAWKIPWTEEPGGLQSMGSLRVRHDWATSLSLFTFMHRRRKRQPTPVFLPGESQGWGSLVGCRLWGRTELDTTEAA